MFGLKNGARIVRIELDNTSRVPRGVVLAETEVDYVTWRVWESVSGEWLTESGNYFPKLPGYAALQRAEQNYNYRRGLKPRKEEE